MSFSIDPTSFTGILLRLPWAWV